VDVRSSSKADNRLSKESKRTRYFKYCCCRFPKKDIISGAFERLFIKNLRKYSSFGVVRPILDSNGSTKNAQIVNKIIENDQKCPLECKKPPRDGKRWQLAAL
jgi:hypothetical protein